MNVKQLSIDGDSVEVEVLMADTWLTRLVGLLRHKQLADNRALVLVPCASIHTIGMRFSIDAVFLDKSGKVLGFKEDLAPYRFCVAPKGTRKVLELASGNAKRTGINLDQVLKFD